MATTAVPLKFTDDRLYLPPGTYRFQVESVEDQQPSGKFEDEKPQFKFKMMCLTDPTRIRPPAPKGQAYNPSVYHWTSMSMGSDTRPSKLRNLTYACVAQEGWDLLQAWGSFGGLFVPDWLVGMAFTGQVVHKPKQSGEGVNVRIEAVVALEDTTDNLERLCFAMEQADAELYAKVAEAADRVSQPALIGSASAL